MHLKENQTYVQGYGSQERNQEAEEEKAIRLRPDVLSLGLNRDLSLDRKGSGQGYESTSRETFGKVSGLVLKFV